MSQKIDELIGTGVIEKTKADYIKEQFEDFTQAIEEWSEKANSIVVTEETQKDLMAEAREGRLLLRAKRIEVEKVRKSLKEQSLSEGRLIDSVAKYLTSLIEPAEKHLELQEKFIEIQEQNKRIKIKAERTKLLQPYKDVIDPDSIQLDLITDEAFATILNGAKFAQDNKIAEALRIEEHGKELARKQNVFQERSLQIAEYRQFYFTAKDLILTTETEEVHFNELMENLVLRKKEYLVEQDRIAKENAKLKMQNEKNQKQIQKLKTIAKANVTPTPAPATTPVDFLFEPTPTPAPITEPTIEAVELSEIQSESTITINRLEYEILKKRYVIAKVALEAVLCFIVPQNLRDLINKAIMDIGEAGNSK
jgi:hypothetical protein